MARTGYTLPVFAVAAAKAALLHLQNFLVQSSVTVDLLPESVEIPIEQVAEVDSATALAMTKSDPGDNLDLTRDTPVWAWVKLSQHQHQALILEAGVGVGKTATGVAAIYKYAHRLFEANLLPLIPTDKTATVRIILPHGRQLAQRTSNEAFGILEGLGLLGTSGISQPMSAADHLEEFRIILHDKAQRHSHLVFCIGSNGKLVAESLSIPEEVIVTTGNWLGALLVEAGLFKVRSVLLLGYQGKLIKLAGGIFNTSSHLADAKLEIIAAAVALLGGDIQTVHAVLQAQTADAAHKTLVDLGLADAVFGHLAQKISQKAENYVKKYADVSLNIGVVLFDRKGKIITQDAKATELIQQFSVI